MNLKIHRGLISLRLYNAKLIAVTVDSTGGINKIILYYIFFCKKKGSLI